MVEPSEKKRVLSSDDYSHKLYNSFLKTYTDYEGELNK